MDEGVIFFSILFFIILGFIIGETIRKKNFDKAIQKNLSDIVSNSEFEILYNKIINNQEINNVIAEQKRHKMGNILGDTLFIMFIISGAIFPALLCFFNCFIMLTEFNDFIENSWPIFVFFFLLSSGSLILSIVIRQSRSLRYKSQIIKEIITSINPSIKYEQMSSNDIFSPLCKEIYWNAGFNDLRSNKGWLSDYMEYNTSSGDYVKLLDLWLKYYYYSNYRKCSYTTDVFEGAIAKITRKKVINNEILIEQNKVFKNKNYIKYDDKEFEKYFDVSASNIENCSFVITPTVKNELLTLAKKYGILFEISIKGNELFIRFSTEKLFEAEPKLKEPINKKKLYKDYVTFKVITILIEHINAIL